jgi:hypothetical protein
MTKNGQWANGNGTEVALHLKENGAQDKGKIGNGNFVDGNEKLSPSLNGNGQKTNGEYGENLQPRENSNDVAEDGATENGDEKADRRLDEYEVDFS